MSDHQIAWTIDMHGIDFRLTCTAAPGSRCRMQCPKGCESWDVTDHEHGLDSGECWMIPWFTEGLSSVWDMIEAYDGKSAPLVSGPVILRWGGEDDFDWCYPADVPEPTAVSA